MLGMPSFSSSAMLGECTLEKMVTPYNFNGIISQMGDIEEVNYLDGTSSLAETISQKLGNLTDLHTI